MLRMDTQRPVSQEGGKRGLRTANLLVSWGEDHEEASPAKPVGEGDAARVQLSPSLVRRGSAVAKIIGDNVKKLQKFASTVKMWVFEETVNGRKLTDIINNDHENVKYLPGHKLPENVVAVANLSEAVQDADLLVFVIPHQFIHRICEEITGRVPKDALGITLIKGIDEGPEGLKLISDIIREKMGIDISVLMGANIANEVAAGKFCETTIGSKVIENGLLFKELLQTPNFRITVVDDADTVELCGALKNIVAVGAGFCDGLRCGDNTKAAVIRLGLMEMIAFARIFCKGQVSTATFLESCGVADLITTCYGGRNRRVAEAFARTGKTIEELEKEMLNGQKLQGPQTSAEVYRILKQKGLLDNGSGPPLAPAASFSDSCVHLSCGLACLDTPL
ncbi:glycerol-3-phosphate dehydrogenase 1-like protein isoform X3 [Mesoplodon densirostris]|uniref:glycerol-3-phosphate dehydrogenase 1-like protein isoform X3 n=1 Tax=Mesoplodon densirostris TaxID=48708 RepID=UPI0028DB41A9|nr:glycerol-3-phosphate dehydrogenase 1-like protein isoform X3 [Mesoplodon densirostris]